GGLVRSDGTGLELVENARAFLRHVWSQFVTAGEEEFLETQSHRRVAEPEDALDYLEVAADLHEDAEELQVIAWQQRELVRGEAPFDHDSAVLALEPRDHERTAGHWAGGWHG